MADKPKVVNSIVLKAITDDPVLILGSRAMEEDEFTGFYGDGDILQPPYPPEQLIRLPEHSDILQQCIDAYKINIVGFGYELAYDTDFDKEDEARKKELESLWVKYDKFFQYCNFEESFIDLMQKVIDDRERIGWGTMEVIEDAAGSVAGFEHVQAHKVRFCHKEAKAISVKTTILNEDGAAIEISYMKKFRKFVQIVDSKKVYFKEFGDPRRMDFRTGEYSESVDGEYRATSLICFTIYCPYTVYGLPRYMGQLLNVQGNRKAEELNYSYFKDGRHMPLAVVVENGKLTEQSIATLEKTKGDLARHKFLILEAEGLEADVSIASDDKKSPVGIRLEPLAQMLEHDGLFQEYCENNRGKIRSAFRLHPIYTGESQDYNRATADTARQITEEQVFRPEREGLCFKLNNLLRPALGISGVSMEFASPSISDKTEIAKALYPYIQAGAASPNMLVDAMGELLGKTFEPFDGDWANKPLTLALKELDSQMQSQQQTAGADTIFKADETAALIDTIKGMQAVLKEVLQGEASQSEGG